MIYNIIYLVLLSPGDTYIILEDIEISADMINY